MPIQQMLLGVGAVAKKTYVDDVFSTYLWEGTGSARSINNGIDTSGEGSLVWIKKRNDGGYHTLYDTDRGVHKPLYSNLENSEANFNTTLTAFNNNGFSLGDSAFVNASNITYTSWTFRKAPGFFNVVTWTGNENAGRQISHGLGSVPGCIMVKCTSHAHNWQVWHRDLTGGTSSAKMLILNNTDAEADGNWNSNIDVDATTFTVGSGNDTNSNNKTYVAYVFAGGEEGYGSSEFDGTSDYLTIPASTSQLTWGSSDSLTLEAYVRITNLSAKSNHTIMSRWVSNAMCFLVHVKSDGGVFFAKGPGSGNSHSGVSETSGGYITNNTWHHVAITKNGTSGTVWIDGVSRSTFTWDDACSPSAAGNVYIGEKLDSSGGYTPHGNISNVRITIGQALYTSSFTPSTTPLTTTSQSATASNVKILCCNETDVLSSIKTTGTISKNGDIKGSSLHPFNSAPDAVFGDAGDQNVIKCGSYVGNGNANGPEIFVGWEPSWLLIKRSSGTEDWMLFDNIRTSSRTDMHLDDLRPNLSNAEGDGAGGDSNSYLNWTSTGFKLQSNTGHTNNADDTYIFCAIRRPDGYVGKPPELGTGVFSLDVADGSTDPSFISNFPVDFSFYKQPASSDSWYTGARLIGTKYLKTDSTAAEATSANFTWDYSDGWRTTGLSSSWQAWSWKRHAGFDVVTYTGNGTSGTARNHSLNKTPEMIWCKDRNNAYTNWMVYHKGLNGGTDPEDRFIYLNQSDAELNNSSRWGTLPTSSVFYTGSDSSTNGNGQPYIAMLFASVDGISKCGSYLGSTSDLTLNLGFVPRLFICKQTTVNGEWVIFDSLRGIGSGNDGRLYLNSAGAEFEYDYVETTSNGITLKANTNNDILPTNTSRTCIYYAHA